MNNNYNRFNYNNKLFVPVIKELLLKVHYNGEIKCIKSKYFT